MSQKDILQDLSQIRTLMEKSSKFISLSGLSGILAGIYTLLALAFLFVNQGLSLSALVNFSSVEITFVHAVVALILLVTSVVTGIYFAKQKAKRSNQNIWNSSTKTLLAAVSVPLVTGGVFACLAAFKGMYDVSVASLLVFYGIALFSGSNFTFSEIKILGILQILLGLLTLCFSQLSFLFFGLGFGVLHILYGTLILKKYEA